MSLRVFRMVSRGLPRYLAARRFGVSRARAFASVFFLVAIAVAS